MWELASWVISAGTTVVTFVRSVGGPVQFLVEVGTYGFACYVAIWVVVPLVLAGLAGLERVSGRQTLDVVAAVAAGVAVLAAGAAVRFGLFHEDVAQDLDAIGTTFSALVGVAVLCVPLVLLWYFRGSMKA